MTPLSPSVSVVIPTYNRADSLPRAIDSALAQGWPALEVVVVDDGSTDDTQAILGRYSALHPSAVRVFSQHNGGAALARNAGIRSSRHDFIAFLDSDDSWEPGKLELQMRLFCDDPRLDLTHTGSYKFELTSRETVVREHWEDAQDYVIEQLLEGCCINMSTVIARRRILAESRLFDTSLKCCEDLDLWLRLAAAGHRMGYLAEPLTNHYVHRTGLSGDLLSFSGGAERALLKLFQSHTLPRGVQARRRYYLAKCYLNSACRNLQAGDGSAARSALRRATCTRPASVRPGWIRMYLQSLLPKPRGAAPSVSVPAGAGGQ